MIARNELTDYFTDLSRLALLTREEELDLSRRARAGDVDARHRLVEGNLRLVVQLAKRFRSSVLPMQDLVAEGNVGLLLAVDRFDPELGYRFSTYAAWWIRQSIGKAIQRSAHIVHFGAAQVGSVRALGKTQRQFVATTGREATPTELRAALGVSAVKFATTARAANMISTAWCPCDSDTQSISTEPDPAEAALDRDSLARLRSKLENLTARSREILSLRFGLGGEPPRKLGEIGARFGITRERVRQILQDVMKALGHGAEINRIAPRAARRRRTRSADATQDLSRAMPSPVA